MIILGEVFFEQIGVKISLHIMRWNEALIRCILVSLCVKYLLEQEVIIDICTQHTTGYGSLRITVIIGIGIGKTVLRIIEVFQRVHS